MQPTRAQSEIINKNELIKSYGFVEQVNSNQNFLEEALKLATKITGANFSFVSLLDDDNQYVLSQNKTEAFILDVEQSLCQFTIQQDELLQIENTHLDERTKDLPIIEIENIVFYAGAQLVNKENRTVGSLCVVDKHAKKLNQYQIDILKLIGKQVMKTLDQKRSLIKLIKKINTNFKPVASADISYLQAELSHLHTEVINQNELVKAQKENLERKNKELNEFAYNVAHDVKAPLRTIRSFAQIIEQELEKNASEYTEEYFDLIKRAVVNLDALITDLLDFASMDKNINHEESISLKEVMDIVLINLTNSIKSKNAQVEVPENNIMVKGHKTLFVSLFQNLISNGIKYQNGQETPKIKIDMETQNDRVYVSVSDNGIGIAEKYFEDIFKPFRRLHDSRTYEGSGIGLATCKKILDQFGAELTVHSVEGEGSVFSFELVKG